MASKNVAGKIFRPALTVTKVIAGYRDPMRKTGGENRSRPSRTAAFVNKIGNLDTPPVKEAVRRLCGIGWIRYSGVSRQDVLRASSGCDSPDIPRRLTPCSSGTGTGLEPASLLWTFSIDGLPPGEELARDPFRSGSSAHGPTVPRRHAGPSPARGLGLTSVLLCTLHPSTSVGIGCRSSQSPV
jgi:hypothetical protein